MGERGIPLSGQAVAATTTDANIVIPWGVAGNAGLVQVGIIADGIVFLDIDASTAARADLATTGLKVAGNSVEAIFTVPGASFGASGRATRLHLAAATTADVHVNWYRR